MIKKEIGDGGKFRWRSHEISRIEGLSDAVFAFAITRLVVSLDTRNNIQESALNCMVALISISLVVFGGPRYAALAGLTYMLTGVVLGTHGTLMGRRRGELVKELAASTEAKQSQSS
jgi:hypothetical protein